MRLATFNISSGRVAGAGFDPGRLRDAVARLDVDVLALQEVDRDQPRSGGADLTRLAADAMGAKHWVFAPTLFGTPGGRWRAADGRDPGGPAYGCALLSRRPLDGINLLRIPAVPVMLPLYLPGPGVVIVREEPRVAIVVRTELADAEPATIVATHLPFVPGWKHWQLRRLVRALRASPDPLLLLGDLNLQSAARLSGYRDLAALPTFPAGRPRLQLDHVMARGRALQERRVVSVETPEVGVSDHRPLVVELG